MVFWLLALKVITLLAVVVLLYKKLKDPTNFGSGFWYEISLLSTNVSSIALLSLSIILMPLNWFMEAVKWKFLVQKQHVISNRSAFEGVLTGLSLGFVTPHAVGDYVGRLIQLPVDNKTQLIGSVWLGKVVQMIVTALFGLIGVIAFFRTVNFQINTFLIGLALLTLFSSAIVGFIFLKSTYSGWIARFQGYFKIVLSYSSSELLKILGLAISRYLIFSIQFVLILFAFKVPLAFLELFSGVTWILLLKSIIPSFNFMSDLGIRELSTITFFDQFDIDQIPVVSASLILWLINILIPMLIGLVLFIKLKLPQAK